MSKVNGKVIFKGEVTKINDKFQKQEFVVETFEQYPQRILLTATQDKTSMLNLINVNDSVDCSINIKGREWTNAEGVVKYFTTLEVWAINLIDENPQPKNTKTSGIVANFEEEQFKEYAPENDLPF